MVFFVRRVPERTGPAWVEDRVHLAVHDGVDGGLGDRGPAPPSGGDGAHRRHSPPRICCRAPNGVCSGRILPGNRLGRHLRRQHRADSLTSPRRRSGDDLDKRLQLGPLLPGSPAAQVWSIAGYPPGRPVRDKARQRYRKCLDSLHSPSSGEADRRHRETPLRVPSREVLRRYGFPASRRRKSAVRDEVSQCRPEGGVEGSCEAGTAQASQATCRQKLTSTHPTKRFTP